MNTDVKSKLSQRRYSPELKERAVRLVRQLREETGEKIGTVKRVAEQLDVGPESLRAWVKQDEIDNGARAGTTSEEAAEIKTLRQEVKELRRANAILKSGGCRMGCRAPVWSATVSMDRATGGRDQPTRGRAGLGVQAMRQSLRRLWVAQMSFHSLSTAARPRWATVRIPRLCLICAKTGSIEAARFL